jgi:tripartite-type tricarboxylate transporter receptor subunit TctC
MKKLPGISVTRRGFMRAAAVAALTPGVAGAAGAEDYPRRTVRIVVPAPPAGGADSIVRLLGNRLAAVWGQQVVVENKAGGAGSVGARAVAQSPPDGHNLLLGTLFLATNRYLAPTSDDPSDQLVAVVMLCGFPNLMVVPNSSPAGSVQEFIDYARANPGKLSFGSSGVGLLPHLCGELFKRETGIAMTHVPYRGVGPSLNDLIPGRLDLMFGSLPGLLPQAQAGVIRALAVTSAKRSSFAPDIPTMAEGGVPGFDVSAWYGLFASPGTPLEIVDKIQRDTVAALEYPAVREGLEKIGAEITPSTPAELAAHVEAEKRKWSQIIKDANIRLE